MQSSIGSNVNMFTKLLGFQGLRSDSIPRRYSLNNAIFHNALPAPERVSNLKTPC